METVLLAMSGGVDSSTAAVLLQDQGYEVVGCTMQLWDYTRNPTADGTSRPGRCCSLDDVYDARRVAERLGIRFYVLNLEKQFESRVVAPFIQSYLTGHTPIPCTACNTFLKFDELLKFARQVGISKVATGHYARVAPSDNGGFRLLTGQDPSKDQTYYLFELNQEQLAATLFPVGDYDKPRIREIATRKQLTTAAKRDSQEICFVSDGNYRNFIDRFTSEVSPDLLPVLDQFRQEGLIRFKDGTQLGRHRGCHRYTVGQRRGLGIAHARPLYVVRIDTSRNEIIVGHREDLFSRGLKAMHASWVAGAPPADEFDVQVRIRSTHPGVEARVRVSSNGEAGVEVEFAEPQSAVTAGQAAVFYRGREVLGGAWISGHLR